MSTLTDLLDTSIRAPFEEFNRINWQRPLKREANYPSPPPFVSTFKEHVKVAAYYFPEAQKFVINLIGIA